jgi:hypothetical protein
MIKQVQEVTKYDLQAERFLKETSSVITMEFVEYGFHFVDDKEKRDIYSVTITKGDRKFTFRYGNSINNSGEYILFPSRERINLKKNVNGKPIMSSKDYGFLNGSNSKRNENFKVPSAYDILASLTKYDVGSFENFCDEFGYDKDSIKAHKIYDAVLNEWSNIKMLYSDTEIAKLQEIQ